ncbi:DinB family protein [Alphaproteobacteria bacterium]|nr:DinB family protein [Alphaproteobacteria bacterium]
MNNKEYLLNLLNYNSWANDEFFKVIIKLSSEEINKQRKSFMNSIRNSLNHLLVIDKVWLINMKKEKHTFDNLQTILYENMEQLWKEKKKEEQLIKNYVENLSDKEFEEIVECELIGGNKVSISRSMIITHLVMHGGYHRGIIAEMFGQIPLPPIAQDITTWEKSKLK